MGGVFPLRKLRTDARPDQKLCPDPARTVVVQTGQTPQGPRMGDDPGAGLTQPPGPDLPGWDRRPAPALSGLEPRTPPVKNVGKPCAGEPHARFDGRGLETEATPARVETKAARGETPARSVQTYRRTTRNR